MSDSCRNPHSLRGQGSRRGSHAYSSTERLNAHVSFGGRRNADECAGHVRDTCDLTDRPNSRSMGQHDSFGGQGRNRSNSRTDRGHHHVEAGPEHARPSGNGGPRPRREVRATGYKRLEELLSKEKEEVLMQLSTTNFGFEKLLNEPDNIRRDFRALICRALTCACQCTTSRVSLHTLLGKVQKSMFIKYHMTQHIISLKDERDPRVRHDVEIQDIITVIRTLVDRLPSSTREVKASLLLLQPTIDVLYERGLIYDSSIRSQFEELNEFVEEVEKTQCEHDNHVTRRRINTAIDDDTPPPNDFRGIPIFPTLDDLTMENKPYLRKNRLDGVYDDVDHYLDVQFRLLREDLIRPLREGIMEYLQHKDDRNYRRTTDIRIYNDVTVEYPVCAHDCVIYRVHFDVSRFKGVRWQSSKRLIFGSLVCLSVDDFQTVRFATVANREPNDLEKGFLELKFEMEDELENIRNEKFIMVETSSFFETYRHVLQSLKNITEENMPMRNYIIEARHEVDAPYYLLLNKDMTYDLAPLIEIDNGTPKRMCVKIAGNAWPSAHSLQLDDSQFSALKTALTREFAVIQGPPGTGKTYVGLKIVHALLHNKECWTIDAIRAEVKESPIFVVCFTNHALDQFLEGIHVFLPDSIVRVGGRSNSESMKKFNLVQLRQNSRERKEVPRHILDRKRDLQRDMDKLRYIMESAKEKINLTTSGVIDELFLQTGMPDGHYESLTEDGGQQHKPIISWLGLDGSDTNVQNDSYFYFTEIKEETNEEDEQLEVAEEADLITEQRLVDIDDADEDNKRAMQSITEKDRIKNTVRKQLAFVPEQMGQFKDKDGFQMVIDRKKRERIVKRQLQSLDRMTDVEAARVHNVWRLQFHDRWRLYRFWISRYCDHERQTLFEHQEEYNTLGKQLKEVKLEEDLLLMRNAKVIGMTTTGAAKYRDMIQRIQSKIVIVEEAAEVLEAHIVSSLTQGCEHLILIGDHQQLRPNPTVYDLAKRYNLEISLFERMVKNGMHCERLNTQHRMRPEVSSIMRNHFYNGLQDAPNVHSYENIKGVANNMLFIDHEHKEAAVNDTLSKSNLHEAEFLVCLCKYMIQQGYKPSEITILTTYTGQLFQFKKIMKSTFFKGVRVCAVDNYQGEENEIILLSLVRSNDEGKIGFLKEKTRMCVALSRAKKGLFCIGNMKLLSTRDTHWMKIITDLRQKNLLRNTIRLCCQNHPGTTVEVRVPNDFTKCPEGGCNKPCVYRLECGHVCTLPCHPYDLEHKNVKCSMPCTKVHCPIGHPCKRRCYQKCEEACTVSVKKILMCGHTQMVPCFKEIDTVTCTADCTNILECGHACKEKCTQPCTSRCQEIVRKFWPCGHIGEYKCHVDDPLSCSNPCETVLKCGHPCQGTCGGCTNGRLHQQCRSKCGRTLVCGHECLEPCTRNCPPCRKPCENRCVHSKCPKTCGEKCIPCTMPCECKCKHKVCTKQCGKLCNRTRCDMPCKKTLKPCGHQCAGLCGEPCPKKCLVCDKDELTTIMFGDEDEPDARFIELEDCGHVIESTALDTWMDQEDEESKNVQPKCCPVCKVPVRRNLRYGNVIKQLQIDIERVKSKIIGDELEIRLDKQQLQLEIQRLSVRESQNFLTELDASTTAEQVVAMKNKLRFVARIEEIRKAGSGKINARYAAIEINIKKELDICRKWILKPRNHFSEQMLDDVASELQRLSFYMELYVLKSALRTSKISSETLNEYMHIVKKYVTSVGPLKEKDVKTTKYCLKKIRQESGVVAGISDKERVEIVQAMSLSQGHWFKCPKGHIYAIGDCGGATIESKCPECGSTIGGTGHRLRDDNKLAREMDGASHAAWSEQANLGNYRLDGMF